MNKSVRNILDVLLYVVAFLMISIGVQLASGLIWALHSGQAIDAVLNGLAHGQYSMLLIVSTVISGVLTIVLFGCMKWSPFSNKYIRTRPWGVIFWTVMLTIGLILPTEWLYEKLQIAMDESTAVLFEGVMREPFGYIAIGIVAPIAEEMVFRGAVLRTLLKFFSSRAYWVAIVVSALLFALVHGNMAQGVHAFLIGLLLGWMYYRTGSIVLGIVLHWVNNSVAYVMFNLMPEVSDGKLIDLFRGDERTMYMALFFSMLVFLPSLFQLVVRTKSNN